jgi:phage shock protein PspC (stress-responsive transcriptional regulator)
MKTTENISLAGYAFTIEKDAYEELEAYLNDINEAFATDPSAEEITADIEARAAELLKEKYISGMVVDIEMVKAIKKRIGDPKMLANEEAEPIDMDKESDPQKDNEKRQNNWKSKRMYRNMDERIFGGVCSGLGTYFGIDKVLFRILFLIFFFIGFIGFDDGPYFGFSVLGYICLWIAMPAARTSEQKREMKGKPMNLRNYKEKDFDFEKEAKEVAQSPAGQTVKRAGGVFLGMLLLIVGLGGLLGGLILPALPEIFDNEVISHISRWGELDADDQLVADIVCDTTFWSLTMVMLGIFCVWFIYNGVMLLFDLKSPSWRPGLVLFIAWLMSFFVIAGWVIKTVADILPSLI